MAAEAVLLVWRGVLRIDGSDRAAFLQGIVSNDVTKISEDHAIWAAFLTPQGKFLHEFFMIEKEDALLLDCEAARSEDLRRRLSRYKLRAKARLGDASEDFVVAAAFGVSALALLGLESAPSGQAVNFGDGKAFVDPRLPELGARLILPRNTAQETLSKIFGGLSEPEAYDRLRLRLVCRTAVVTWRWKSRSFWKTASMN